jgi:hypothetical protein
MKDKKQRGESKIEMLLEYANRSTTTKPEPSSTNRK